MAQKIYRIHAKHTHENVQSETEQTPVDMLQLRYSVASDEFKGSSDRFLQTMVIKCYRREAAGDVMSQSLETRSQSETFMDAVVMGIVINPFFIRPVSWIIEQNMYSIFDRFWLTQFNAETEKDDETGVLPTPEQFVL